ncbi:MAG: hypothetical protein H0T09_06205 [Actinobacteria bacterium]|nr:hypothetical protein [Actinomycetota bacterium]
MPEKTPDERAMIEELERELERLKVSDLLVQTLYTISSLGYRRLDAETRDLEQARLAIEALRALAPVLHGSVPETLLRDLNQVTANMQLAYAKAVSESVGDTSDTKATDADASGDDASS